MATPFDHISTDRDLLFANHAIGQLQRAHVWNYVEKITPELGGMDMLELNGGVGDDALLFGDPECNIIATDISEEMLKITQQKVRQVSMQHHISSQYLDLETFGETSFNKKFDFIFSNFGGLNRIGPEALRTLLAKLPFALNNGGRFVAVVMPRFCIWEAVHHLFRFSARKAFRRIKEDGVAADGSVKTWYYSPGQIIDWSKGGFTHVISKPIGLVLPPSYMGTFKSVGLLNHLNRVERKLSRFSLLAGLADYYLIDLRVKA